jgi:hypothetical protein
MLYAILCYDSEDVVHNWTPAEDARVMAQLDVVQQRLLAKGQLGPVGRLGPTRSARTIRKATSAVTDGPFAETKEQSLGFYIVDCASIDEAEAIARDLGKASDSKGAYEIRPMILFRPGGPVGEASTSAGV